MTRTPDVDILLIGRDRTLLRALRDAGFAVAGVAEDEDLYAAMDRRRPAAVLLLADAPSRATLEHLASLNRCYPQPMLLLHRRQDAALTRAALDLGVSAYVSEGLSPAAWRALIEVEIARQRQFNALRGELRRSQQRLAERKLIDSAKCALMERLGLCEAAAYRALKTRAMNGRHSMADAAQALLDENGTR